MRMIWRIATIFIIVVLLLCGGCTGKQSYEGSNNGNLQTNVPQNFTPDQTESDLNANFDSTGDVLRAPVLPNHYCSGWNHTFGEILEGESVEPVYVDVSKDLNAIGYDAIWIKGMEQFVVDIRIEGQVDFSALSFEFKLPDGVQFVGLIHKDGYSVCQYNEKSRMFKFALASPENIINLTDLCSIQLITKSDDLDIFQLNIFVTEIAKFDENGEELIVVKNRVVCSDIRIWD